MRGVAWLVIFDSLWRTIFAGNSTSYQVNYNFQKKTCENSEKAFKATNVPTSLTCSSICASDVDCESFFYFPTSSRCDGCKQTYSTDGQLKGAREQTVYYTMATPVSTTSTAITTTTYTSKEEEVYRYTGCFKMRCDDDTPCSGREISGINVTACFDYCNESEGVKVSTIATQGEICYCNMKYDTALTAVCDTPCSGNTDEMCGGTWVISVYSKD